MPQFNFSRHYSYSPYVRMRRIEVPKLGTEDEEGNMINSFRVGCDPEFLFLGADGATIPASTYFPHAGAIGYDHNGRVAEFRPEPSKGVYTLLKKIQTLVNDGRIQKINAKLRAGALCNGDALGGHVHFGFNCFDIKPTGIDASGTYYPKGKLNDKGGQVVKALDALTKVLEHLDILPTAESAARRRHTDGYGRFGDVRDSSGHMEYRSMASWLYDPRVAFLCLTAAKLAAADPAGAYEALKDCTSFTAFSRWLNAFKSKDINALRTSERLLDNGLQHLQVDATTDFRSRWESLNV